MKVYIVSSEDELYGTYETAGAFSTEAKAIKFIEENTNKKQKEWEFDTGAYGTDIKYFYSEEEIK